MRLVLAIATVSVALSGCSTFKGSRLSRDGALGADSKTNGVPFMLTRPVFKAQKDDKGKYSVVLSYEPDPEQRFSLRMSPALLASIGFKASWGDNGALSGLTASATDQLVPTIVSVLKLTTDVAGALAATTGLAQDPKTIINCAARGTRLSMLSCALDKVKVTTPSGAPADCTPMAVTAIKARFDYFKDADGEDKGDVAASLYANSADEAACYQAAAKYLQDDAKGLVSGNGSLSAMATKAFDAFVADPGNAVAPGVAADARYQPGRDAARTAMEKAITDLDADRIRRISAAIRRLQDHERKYVIRDLALPAAEFPPAAPPVAMAGNGAPPPSEEEILLAIATPVVAGLEAAELSGDDPGQILVQIKSASSLAKSLTVAAQLLPEQWLQRRVADLDRRESKAVRDALVAAPGTDPKENATVKVIRTEKAAAVGMGDEYRRMLDIQRRLDKLPSTPSDARQAATVDYLVLRDESERLNTLLISRLTTAKGIAVATVKDEAPLPETPWVSESCIKQSKAADWFYTEGTDAREFVVVLRRPSTGEALVRNARPCGK